MTKQEILEESKKSEQGNIPGKKLRPIRGVIVSAKQETPDTWTLNIFVSEKDKNYVAGQFISIGPHQFPELKDLVAYFEYCKRKTEPIRAYSLTSAPHEKYVSITIKPESYIPYPDSFPPLLSPFLASNMLVGREIEFVGYAGAYIMPADLAKVCDHVIHLVAGSGIVPSFSIIKDELHGNKNPHAKHTLVFVNKTHDDIIFKDEIEALKKQFPKRFAVKHFLTQCSENKRSEPDIFRGRPQLSDVEKLIGDKNKTLIFACGPAITKWQKKHAAENNLELKPRFMEWVQDVITRLEIDKKHFKREIYG